MRFIFSLLLFISANPICAQDSYVYKYNSWTNKMEVFKKTASGLEISPIYSISKDPYTGYIEMNALSKQPEIQLKIVPNPYASGPTYYDVMRSNEKLNESNQRRSKEMLDNLIATSNEMNRIFWENRKEKEKQNRILKEEAENDIKNLYKNNLRSDDKKAKSILQFYNSVQDFPLIIKDGWHILYEVVDMPLISVTKLFEESYKEANIIEPKQLVKYIAKVSNNEIIDLYYWFSGGDYTDNFCDKVRNVNAGKIKNGKCNLQFKVGGEIATVMFIDEIINHDYKLEKDFAFLKIIYPPSSNLHAIAFSTNETSNYPLKNLPDLLELKMNKSFAGDLLLMNQNKDEDILVFTANKTYSFRFYDNSYNNQWVVPGRYIAAGETYNLNLSDYQQKSNFSYSQPVEYYPTFIPDDYQKLLPTLIKESARGKHVSKVISGNYKVACYKLNRRYEWKKGFVTINLQDNNITEVTINKESTKSFEVIQKQYNAVGLPLNNISKTKYMQLKIDDNDIEYYQVVLLFYNRIYKVR